MVTTAGLGGNFSAVTAFTSLAVTAGGAAGLGGSMKARATAGGPVGLALALASAAACRLGSLFRKPKRPSRTDSLGATAGTGAGAGTDLTGFGASSLATTGGLTVAGGATLTVAAAGTDGSTVVSVGCA